MKIIPISELRNTKEISALIDRHETTFVTKQGSAHGVILQHDDYNELIEKNKEKDIMIDILRSENELLRGEETVSFEKVMEDIILGLRNKINETD
ncbi:hypothetical protein ABC345_03040 [Shouchella sp. 1P09AA]|uniref:hypothetical protein n=1 Tax=unclassified Shouchella TaxID=2893065 RepID=UPI00399F0ED0